MAISDARKKWIKQQMEYQNFNKQNNKKAIVGRIPTQGPLQLGTRFVQKKDGKTYTRKIKGSFYANPIGPSLSSNYKKIQTKKGKVYYRKKVAKKYGPKQLEKGAITYKKKNGSIGYKVRKTNQKNGKKYWKYL